MQEVSQAYKESMKSDLRERGFIMVSFGLINQEIQSNASIGAGLYTYYSSSDGVFRDRKDYNIYATFEEDFTTADGSMLFLPRQIEGQEYIPTGVVSRDMVSEGTVTVNIPFNVLEPVTFKGLTLNFGASYPKNFDIKIGSETIQLRNFTEKVYQTEQVFEDATSLQIKVYDMAKTNSRFRLYNVKFGYGIVYDNEMVIDSQLETYVSPINENVPQTDFYVQLVNFDKAFNVDNPDSVINYLETGQQVDVKYGYQLPETEEIEWLQAATLYCSEWSSDDKVATIRSQDIFRSMENEYYKGTVGRSSYYSLAQKVLIDAGITEYEIDNSLKNIYTYNPIPRVPHKEALQLIANATRSILSIARDGTVSIIPHDIMYGTPCDFTMEKIDMVSTPTMVKQEKTKDVTVARYVYQNNDVEETLMSEDFEATANQVVTFFFNEPSYGYKATFNDDSKNVWFIASGAYYITLRFLISGTYPLEINGCRYKVLHQNYVKNLHAYGRSIVWDNPLISEASHAANLATWLGDYYGSSIEYEYDTRGNPELDCNDVIYQENEFKDNMKVIVVRDIMKFDGAFSGTVTTLREGEN